MDGRAPAAASPPSFASAANRRQRARAAGLDPDYWYPVEYDRAVRPGQGFSNEAPSVYPTPATR